MHYFFLFGFFFIFLAEKNKCYSLSFQILGGSGSKISKNNFFFHFVFAKKEKCFRNTKKNVSEIQKSQKISKNLCV